MIISKRRVIFFSDCVIGIATTIMVFKFGVTLKSLFSPSFEWNTAIQMLPIFLIYLLSFMTLGIMWVGHHNFYSLTAFTNVIFLWYNLHLLFWFTWIPYATYLAGNYPLNSFVVAIYGFIMLMVSVTFTLSRRYVMKHNMLLKHKVKIIQGELNRIAKIKQIKAKMATGLYFVSIPLSFISIPLAYICMIIPIILFILPDEVKNERIAKSLFKEMNEME